MSKTLLIEDKRSGYSMKRYIAHLKQIQEFDFSVIAVSNSFLPLYIPVFKYLVLPLKILFSSEQSILIPTEGYSYLLWFWRGKKSIVVCHDLHDLMNRNVPFYHKCFIRFILSGLVKANYIVSVSKHTQQDLLKYKPKLNKNKMQVIHNTIENHWFNLTDKLKIDEHFKQSLPNSYAFMVGTNAWYKNNDWGLKVIKELNVTLVKVGALSNNQIDYLNTHEVSYMHLQNLSEVELKYLYAKASFLFFPSIHEGFGWPVLEAMALKCPVICSDKASIPEIGGDHVLYVDLKSIEASVLSIKSYLKDKEQIKNDQEMNYMRAKTFRFNRFRKSYVELLAQ